MTRCRIAKQPPCRSVRLAFLSALLILTLGACGVGGGMDAMLAVPETPTRQVIEQDMGDAAEGGEMEDATEAAILEAAKRSVEEAAAELEAP